MILFGFLTKYFGWFCLDFDWIYFGWFLLLNFPVFFARCCVLVWCGFMDVLVQNCMRHRKTGCQGWTSVRSIEGKFHFYYHLIYFGTKLFETSKNRMPGLDQWSIGWMNHSSHYLIYFGTTQCEIHPVKIPLFHGKKQFCK